MPACAHGGEPLEPLFAARDYVTGHAFEVRRCARCGLALTAPRPDDPAAYYPQGYYRPQGARRFPSLVEALQGALYAGRARAVERLAGGPGAVLDIGCGPGLLLQAFRRRGWRAHGTELSEASAAYARALGLDVHVGTPASGPWPADSFDAVVLWHALEHWPEPQAALAQAAHLLRPGGALLVGVPNFGSLEARVARDRWFHLDVPRHLAHFTPGVLRAALRAEGLEPRRTSFVAPEFDTFSFVQSALNLLGLRQNALYNLLRGRRARVLGARAPLAEAASLLLAAPLGLLALPATLLLSLAGQGSSMAVLAVKGTAR